MVDLTKSSLTKMSIFELRGIGREVGVKSPTAKKKETIIEEIMDIVNGNKEPYVRPNAKGRPPLSSNKFDYVSNPVPNVDLWDVPTTGELKVSSSTEDCIKTGIVEITTKGFGFIQEDYNVDSVSDAYIETTFIKRYNLKSGDRVTVSVRQVPPKYITSVVEVLKINGKPANANIGLVKNFKQIKGEKPVGKLGNAQILNGERVLVINNAETEILNFYNSFKGTKFLVNANSLPENFIDGAINASCFDKPTTRYRTVDIVVNSALRIAERGEDVVVCLMDIAFLPIAFMEYSSDTLNNSNYSCEALNNLKQIIACGKNMENAGSVTLVCGVNKNVANYNLTVDNIKILFNKVI